jgi:hypothetical protein
MNTNYDTEETNFIMLPNTDKKVDLVHTRAEQVEAEIPVGQNWFDLTRHKIGTAIGESAQKSAKAIRKNYNRVKNPSITYRCQENSGNITLDATNIELETLARQQGVTISELKQALGAERARNNTLLIENGKLSTRLPNWVTCTAIIIALTSTGIVIHSGVIKIGEEAKPNTEHTEH